MWIIKRLFRIYAAIVLFIFVVFATSRIGTISKCEPTTWEGMWSVVGMIAAFMFVGFMAGRESKE